MTTEAATIPEQPWIPKDSFGLRLVMVRRQLGLTVEQAAKATGMAHPTWSTWERGALPRDMVKAVSQIAAALGVNQEWLMWGDTKWRFSPQSEMSDFRVPLDPVAA